jgi:hypothetical protein
VIEDSIVEALRAAIASVTGTHATKDGGPALIALGWATVETDRAIAELANALAIQPASFEVATGSAALGSSALVATGVLEGAAALAIVEPSTEGRLAAHLARHGEGPTVAWLAEPARATAEGPEGPRGPFGPERIATPRADGLLRILVAASPGTISR